MKRLLEEADRTEETEVLVQYLERKLAKKKAQLKQLRKRDKRNLVLQNLFDGYVDNRRNRALFFRDSKRYENLLTDLSYCDDKFVGHRDCRLTYCARSNGGHIEIKFVSLQQGDIAVELSGTITSYLMKPLKQLVQVRCAHNGGEAPCETEEHTTDVVLVEAMLDEQAAKYWRGPHDCLVSRSFDRVADRSGEACGWWTREGFIESGDAEHINDEELARDDWLQQYGHFCATDGLWYCKRTWAEKGEKEQI